MHPLYCKACFIPSSFNLNSPPNHDQGYDNELATLSTQLLMFNFGINIVCFSFSFNPEVIYYSFKKRQPASAFMNGPLKRKCKPDSASSLKLSSTEDVVFLLNYQ